MSILELRVDVHLFFKSRICHTLIKVSVVAVIVPALAPTILTNAQSSR